MVAQNNKTKEEIIIEDSEWDTSAPIDSYYNKVAETLKMAGIKSNPPSEVDSTGLIVVSSEEFGAPGKGITFHTADKKSIKGALIVIMVGLICTMMGSEKERSKRTLLLAQG